ncbi:hypothetical protein RFI_22625 [Reticulomyxa filosa]|uniref:Uncharacterized protein n=1 Tax=Reticulomyxa filosa TaxID=46433 RepID=X6MM61_RETFI|nr:hypothetical protein RFI_22625 [Reticulomyxa filosa]|eukprot:ETO14741.1 hypothetical protein RFI_22625 [Reticulomyxa filosa]
MAARFIVSQILEQYVYISLEDIGLTRKDKTNLFVIPLHHVLALINSFLQFSVFLQRQIACKSKPTYTSSGPSTTSSSKLFTLDNCTWPSSLSSSSRCSRQLLIYLLYLIFIVSVCFSIAVENDTLTFQELEKLSFDKEATLMAEMESTNHRCKDVIEKDDQWKEFVKQLQEITFAVPSHFFKAYHPKAFVSKNAIPALLQVVDQFT